MQHKHRGAYDIVKLLGGGQSCGSFAANQKIDKPALGDYVTGYDGGRQHESRRRTLEHVCLNHAPYTSKYDTSVLDQRLTLPTTFCEDDIGSQATNHDNCCHQSGRSLGQFTTWQVCQKLARPLSSPFPPLHSHTLLFQQLPPPPNTRANFIRNHSPTPSYYEGICQCCTYLVAPCS